MVSSVKGPSYAPNRLQGSGLPELRETKLDAGGGSTKTLVNLETALRLEDLFHAAGVGTAYRDREFEVQRR